MYVNYTSIKLILKLRNGHEIEGKPTKRAAMKIQQRKLSRNEASSTESCAAEVLREKEKSDLGSWQTRVRGPLTRAG